MLTRCNMMKFFSASFALGFGLLSIAAQAGTQVAIDLHDSSGKHSLTKNECDRMTPDDLMTLGAGEDESFVSACYSGHPKEVEEILENLSNCGKHWKLKSFETVRVHKDLPKQIRARFVHKKSKAHFTLVLPACR